MDRDIALSVLTAVTAIKTAVLKIAANTEPTTPADSRNTLRSGDLATIPEINEETKGGK